MNFRFSSNLRSEVVMSIYDTLEYADSDSSVKEIYDDISYIDKIATKI